tara:strand:- start:838 stop:1107 length:270 start_codon:yes stop_codon:yes gene_type:complete
MSKLNNIVNNLFDIIISLVRMVGSYGRDVWDSVSIIWKENHLTPPKQEDDYIWNGGETFRIDDESDENTPTPYDDVVIKYDGIMDEVEE